MSIGVTPNNLGMDWIDKENKFDIQYLLTRIIICVSMMFICYFLWGKTKNKVKSVFKKKKPTTVIPVLVADIGGTNCRLRLLNIPLNGKQKPIEIKKDVLRPWEHESIEHLLKTFIQPFDGTENYPHFAVIGIPGAVVNNTMLELCHIEHWKKTNGDDLAKKLNLKKLLFLNDFVCIGYGVQADLKQGKDYIILNKKKINPKEKMIALGPGTGLGVCYLIKNKGDKYHNIYPTEGSHMDYASKNSMQFEYMEFLQKYFNIEYVSSEKACSGPSLIPLYKFLLQYYKGSVKAEPELQKKISKITASSNPNDVNPINAEIVNKGIEEKCPLCKAVLEFFVETLGNLAGNMGIYTLPYGGIYIVGSLSASLQKIFKTGIFQRALLHRGEQNDLLKDIPLILVLETNLGMIGAIECAKRMALEEVNVVIN
ncbi:MAG: glucokinase [archaeon]|nr:glucokinase [archaeon]